MQVTGDGEHVSTLAPLGYQSNSCGYCKDIVTGQRTQESSVSYYLKTTSIWPEHYQETVDRGMRRSGTLIYKPDVKRGCCPHYTIRLPAKDFKPSRDQRNAINRWNRFVLGEEYINECARRFPKSREEKRRRQQTFDLVEVVHESEYSSLTKPPEPAHRFEVTLEPAVYSEEKYALFENYQRCVHHEARHEISKAGFRRFLCQSPLQKSTGRVSDDSDVPQMLGSYHQCYRLDGRMIAIGVLDLLPHCVSGVYFIYHQDYEQYNFGKLSALREAALALEGGYGYYYMGYYIHSCQKMRYKAGYKPQQIMDPESLEWFPLDGQVTRLLDEKSYVPIKRELRQTAPEEAGLNEAESNSSKPKVGGEEWTTAQQAAMASMRGVPLFNLEVPGVMTRAEVEEQVDFEDVKVLFQAQGLLAPAQVFMEAGMTTNPDAFKELLVDLAACVGPQVAKNMIVKLD